MTAKTLMIMGTSSSAGKSWLTAALCRSFSRRGMRVAPFKAQNMSNNASVCVDGGEVGRSQALQALAAGVAPQPDMNPILLKPEGDSHSQVIVNGRPWQSLGAKDYFARKRELWPVVTGALERLRSQYELVVIEGAGSPAELNLSEVEIVNMSVARHCQSTVLLVGDIERGGVFAQLLGTLWLLPPEDRRLIQGLVVNKFRGDLQLFDRGRELLEERSETPVLGVLPWVENLIIPEEDAVALAQTDSAIDPVPREKKTDLSIAVIRLPHISNFDDFDPLENVDGVRLYYATSIDGLGRPDVVVLPGSKNTLHDLQWLRTTGLADRIARLAQRGATIVGICGGYQMLGKHLQNPSRLESDCLSANGLGLLDVETVFKQHKQTFQVQAEVSCDAIAPGSLGQVLSGYEIHVGQTTSNSPWLKRTVVGDSGSTVVLDGAQSSNGRVWGCYLHGIFHNDSFRTSWLRSLGVESCEKRLDCTAQNNAHGSALASIQLSLDRMADVIDANLDMNRLEQLIWNPERTNASA
jgi:adenosylcobyric acid synthase